MIGLREIQKRLYQAQQQDQNRPALRIPIEKLNIQEVNPVQRAGMALNKGQLSDSRWSLPDGSAIHAHWYDDHADFHLDRVDPAISPLRHLYKDTKIVRHGAVGGLIGALGGAAGGYAATGKPLGGALGALAGAIGGSITGGTLAARNETLTSVLEPYGQKVVRFRRTL